MSRVQSQIFLGTLLTLLIAAMIIYGDLNESQRMERLASAQRAGAIEVGAELFETYCSGCHGIDGKGVPGLCPPLNDKYLFTDRLKDVGWSGALEDYVTATVSSGRLASTRPDLYPGVGSPAMPAWSERYGGPLRDDQIRDLAAFVLNWESTAVSGVEPTTIAPPMVKSLGTDITVALPTGDLQKGQELATSLGCAACHIMTNVGPAWAATAGQAGIGTRAATRLTQNDYTGKATTPEQYLLESIVQSNVYLVSGYASGIMPDNYAERLSLQDVADLIAYLLSSE